MGIFLNDQRFPLQSLIKIDLLTEFNMMVKLFQISFQQYLNFLQKIILY